MVHVLASHTSVGAALVTTWLATVAVRRDRPELLDYVRRYGVFLLVFSYVLGSITGPGIWFAATVASPRGLSALIHGYVWYWATEWVLFVVEVIGIYLLVYLAGRVDKASYLRVAWIFGLASWATMLVIVGTSGAVLGAIGPDLDAAHACGSPHVGCPRAQPVWRWAGHPLFLISQAIGIYQHLWIFSIYS